MGVFVVVGVLVRVVGVVVVVVRVIVVMRVFMRVFRMVIPVELLSSSLHLWIDLRDSTSAFGASESAILTIMVTHYGPSRLPASPVPLQSSL